MNLEERRLHSFGRWPHTDTTGAAAFLATPIKLAKSGFYHHPTPQYPDRVVCFCCGVALVHWNRHHDPWTEHCKRSPVCGFVTGAYSMYLSEERRRASFINWPLPNSYAANPDRLAKSGFIYAPSQSHIDRCVCFCCGVALVRWDPNDDPWTEHVKHSKACPFVRGAETGNIPLADAPEADDEPVRDTVLGQLMLQLDAANIDASAVASSYLLCPITQDLMCDPVFAEDGHTYEREAIKRWLETHNTSPLTNKVLYSKRLVPNHNLRSQLIEFAEALLSKSTEQNLGQSVSGSAHSTFHLHSSISYLPPPPTTTASTAAPSSSSNPAIEEFAPASAWDHAPAPPPPSDSDQFAASTLQSS